MRRPAIIATLTAGTCALGLAAPAAAQTPAQSPTTPPTQTAAPVPSSAGAAGLRYLTWPGRAYRPSPAIATPAPAEAARIPSSTASLPVRPPVIPHGRQPVATHAPAPLQDAPQRQSLTPASAWVSPQAPAYQPRAAEAPAPQSYFASTPEAPPAQAAPGAPWRQTGASVSTTPPTRASALAPAATPAVAPPRTISRAAPPAVAPPAPVAPAPATAPAPPPPAAPVALIAEVPVAPLAGDTPPVEAADPMAPRRDAPIFRLQRPAPAPPSTVMAEGQNQGQPLPAPAPAAAESPGQSGARYYSVHRQAGRQPDATPLPAPVYLDALPVDLTSVPASADLAEPPAAPTLIRNANGRLQAMPDNQDPILP